MIITYTFTGARWQIHLARLLHSICCSLVYVYGAVDGCRNPQVSLGFSGTERRRPEFNSCSSY